MVDKKKPNQQNPEPCRHYKNELSLLSDEKMNEVVERSLKIYVSRLTVCLILILYQSNINIFFSIWKKSVILSKKKVKIVSKVPTYFKTG